MEKSKLRDLMQFVIDSNATQLFNAMKEDESLQLTDVQIRNILNTLESNTKQCFFRVMDKA
tara:strand:- start:255 stop:437 length:183 start_codon:yes stop_codon:yes gene_type:complete